MMGERIPQRALSLRVVAILSGVLLMMLLISAGYALFTGDFWVELKAMSTMPWTVVALLDVYVGFILFSMWVFWREPNPLVAVMVAATIMLLGNIASCLYVLYAVRGAGGSMHKLINGHQ